MLEVHLSSLSTPAIDSTGFGNRRQSVVVANLLVLALVSMGAAAKFAAHGFEHPPLAATSIAVVVAANAFYLHRNGDPTRASWHLLAILLFGLAFSGHASGGFEGPVPMLAPLAPLVAVMLADRRAGWITCVGVIVILTVLHQLDRAGLLEPNPNGETGLLVGRFIAVVSAALVMAVVARSFALDITKLQRQYLHLASFDHLTGLANRRIIDETLARETAQATRNNTWLSLLMIDIDHFKQVNDQYGHEGGDQCLRDVSACIASTVDYPTSMLGRYGGEEFIVVLPNTNPRSAESLAERLRCRVEALSVDRPVTVTVGVASTLGKPKGGVEQLVRQADNALYRGKQTGRNRVVSMAIVT